LSSVASANDEIAVIHFLLQHHAELFDHQQQSLADDDDLSITNAAPPTQQVPSVTSTWPGSVYSVQCAWLVLKYLPESECTFGGEILKVHSLLTYTCHRGTTPLSITYSWVY